MKFSKVIVSVLVANMIIYAWVWSIILVITGIEPPAVLTTQLYLYTGGELALVFAASSVGSAYDLAKAKANAKTTATLGGNA